MLAKLLMIVAAVALAGGTYFSYKTRADLVSVRQEKVDINIRQIKPLLAKIKEQMGALEEERNAWTAALTSKKDKQIALTNNEANVKAKNEEIASLEKEIEDKQAEVAKLEAQLKSVLGDDTIDTITARTEQLSQEIAGLEAELDAGNRELEAARKKAAEVRRVVSDLQRAAMQRSKGIARNSLEGTIIDANKEYGFAVINVGANRGVTPDSRLIVSRGNQRIGALKVTSVLESRTIADIIPSSLAPGEEIAPGDKVVFERVQK